MLKQIITQGILTSDNELIPFWDERIVFEKSEMYGNQVTIPSMKIKAYDFVECVFNLKTKKLEMGIELNYYPYEEKLNFKRGDAVYYEMDFRKLKEVVIVDIVYRDYELVIKRGEKIEQWFLDYFKDVQIDPNALYVIKQWKPSYQLNSGEIVEYEHKLYIKAMKPM